MEDLVAFAFRFVAYMAFGLCMEMLVAIDGIERLVGVRIPRRVPRHYLEGFVSAYMIPLHGLGILFLFEPGSALVAPLPFFARFVVYAVGITACEIGWGFLLDKTLGFFPWDYYALSKWRIGKRGYSLWTLVPMWGLAGLLLERYTSLMLHLSPHVVSYYGF